MDSTLAKRFIYLISFMLLLALQNSTAQTESSEIIALCEAVTPNNTITDPNIQQRGPQSLRWIDEIYQSDTGYLFLKYDFTTNYLNHPQALKYLERFVTVLEENGTQLAMLVLPARAMVHHESLADVRPYPFAEAYQSYLQSIEELRNLGIVVPDLATPLIALDSQEAVYFKQDHHWTPAGARAVAQELAKALDNNSTYQQLAKKEFITELTSTESFLGTYKERIEAVCESKTPLEPIDIYKTKEVIVTDSTSIQTDLFGDKNIPVVLVGTSFGDIESFNFDGFLAEALSTEVLNLAKSSSGQFGSPLSYLADEEIRQTVNNPNILIWERHTAGGLPARFINDFRQLIPSVHGVCSQTEAIAFRSVEAAGGNILDLGIPSGISGSTYYLVADLEDLSISTINLHLHYNSGFKEGLLLGNSTVRPKHFFAEISDTDNSNLNMLRVEFPKEVMSGNITLRICKTNP